MKRLSIFFLILYWLFAFSKALDNKFPFGISLPKFSSYLFPPTYKMFVGPYNTSIYCIYSFYKDSNIIAKINLHDFLSEEIKKELPFANNTFRFSVGLDKSFYYLNDFYLDRYSKEINKNQNQIHTKIIKSIKQDSLAIDYIKTVSNFHKYILERNNNLKGVNKLKIEIFRTPIQVSYQDSKNQKDLTYKVGHKLLYEKYKILK